MPTQGHLWERSGFDFSADSSLQGAWASFQCWVQQHRENYSGARGLQGLQEAGALGKKAKGQELAWPVTSSTGWK